MTAVYVLGGYLAGFILSTILFCLTKGWGGEERGTVKDTFGDWGRGFDVGYDAAASHYQDYKKGFYDGWRECEKKSEGEGEG